MVWRHLLTFGLAWIVAGAWCLADERTSAMTARVDERIDKACESRGLSIGPPASDAEFLRRVSLDLTGTIPTVSEVREFLADERPDKRSQWIERLLASPLHATHLATTWRRALLPTELDFQQLQQAMGLQSWLRDQFLANLRYDRLVAEFLSSTGDERTGPAIFFRMLEAKPEKLAAATSRIFLGVQIQCAECHDHPYDRWTQKEFWGYAAFFARLEARDMMRSGGFRLVDRTDGEVLLPTTQEPVPPQFPDGRWPDEREGGTRRQQLSIWMASRDNRYLAPAAVNRVWEQMFGRGLVHPSDDMTERNAASHPELLRELADFFTESQFDLRLLYRVLANSRTYQRSSRGEVSSEADLWLARMPMKRMTPEQMYDSLQRTFLAVQLGNGLNDAMRREFLVQMKSVSLDQRDYDWGMQQALRLMNGQQTTLATSVSTASSATEADVRFGLLTALEMPEATPLQVVEILTLATVSRLPSEAERTRWVSYLESNAEAKAAAQSDLLWALVNSAEYQLNH